jgi:hypothetical protein
MMPTTALSPAEGDSHSGAAHFAHSRTHRQLAYLATASPARLGGAARRRPACGEIERRARALWRCRRAGDS